VGKLAGAAPSQQTTIDHELIYRYNAMERLPFAEDATKEGTSVFRAKMWR
jgi:hypothetical protein